MLDYIVVITTTPDQVTSKQIARELVTQKLAACVNVVPKITSIYIWNDKLCETQEFLLIIKTKEQLFAKLKEVMLKLHPYDMPEIITLNIDDGNTEYLEWIGSSTK